MYSSSGIKFSQNSSDNSGLNVHDIIRTGFRDKVQHCFLCVFRRWGLDDNYFCSVRSSNSLIIPVSPPAALYRVGCISKVTV